MWDMDLKLHHAGERRGAQRSGVAELSPAPLTATLTTIPTHRGARALGSYQQEPPASGHLGFNVRSSAYL